MAHIAIFEQWLAIPLERVFEFFGNPENLQERNGVTGTIVRDVITYELRLGPISFLVNPLFVAPQMRRTFTHRQRVVEQLLC